MDVNINGRFILSFVVVVVLEVSENGGPYNTIL